MSIWKFDEKKVEKIVGFSELRSYGAFYGSITTLLGFTADKHEGKITGLAAYGKKTNLVNIFKKYINFENGKITTSENFLPFVKPTNIKYLREATKKYSREDMLLQPNIF